MDIRDISIYMIHIGGKRAHNRVNEDVNKISLNRSSYILLNETM